MSVCEEHLVLRLGFTIGGCDGFLSKVVTFAVLPLEVLDSGWLNMLTMFFTLPEFGEVVFLAGEVVFLAGEVSVVLLEGLVGTGGLCLTSGFGGSCGASGEDILIGFYVTLSSQSALNFLTCVSKPTLKRY